ncbi:MAG: hypothetical protein R6U61_02030 [Thermoplasmata archaeon]
MTNNGRGRTNRVTVNLDPHSLEVLENIGTELNISKSEVVRRSLDYYAVVLKKGELSPEKLESVLDLRLRPDKLLFDIGIFQAFLDEIEDGSEKLENEMRDIGKDFYMEYCAIGLGKPMECLKRMERTNLFRLIIESENDFVLIPAITEMKKYIRIFLEGFFSESPISVKLTTTRKKIHITVSARSK